MRVCLVSAEYPPMQGGVGDCTRELGRALVQLGHQVAVITSSRVQPDVPDGIKADAAGSSEPVVYPVVSKWNWSSWRCVLERVHALQSDILHIQYQTAGYGMHPAINLLPWRLRLGRYARYLRIPPTVPPLWGEVATASRPLFGEAFRGMKQRPRVVVTFHDLRVPYLFPKSGVVRKWVTLALARWGDAVIATNVEDYQSLSHSSKWHRQLCPRHLIPIGSNIHPRSPVGYDRAAWRRGLGVDEGEILLCYFGFLNESKGGETLFRALAELLARGQKVKLLMVGGQVGDSDPTNVAYAQHVQGLGDELGLQNRVLWTGYTDAEQVSANLWAADICVLPYRDGASYRRGSFMAALAHGLPIVSTRPRTQIETLVDGDNILLVPADDPAATADAVGRLASTPELRARLARGALQLAQGFTWDSIAAKTTQVYAELLGEPPS